MFKLAEIYNFRVVRHQPLDEGVVAGESEDFDTSQCFLGVYWLHESEYNCNTTVIQTIKHVVQLHFKVGKNYQFFCFRRLCYRLFLSSISEIKFCLKMLTHNFSDNQNSSPMYQPHQNHSKTLIKPRVQNVLFGAKKAKTNNNKILCFL